MTVKTDIIGVVARRNDKHPWGLLTTFNPFFLTVEGAVSRAKSTASAWSGVLVDDEVRVSEIVGSGSTNGTFLNTGDCPHCEGGPCSMWQSFLREAEVAWRTVEEEREDADSDQPGRLRDGIHPHDVPAPREVPA